MENTRVTIEFSWRYGVMGIYKDRHDPLVRIYPLPFIRVTVDLRRNDASK
jgi:hypothetical protein